MRIALVTNGAAVPPSRAARIERLLVAAAHGTRCVRTSMAGETLPLVRKAIARRRERAL